MPTKTIDVTLAASTLSIDFVATKNGTPHTSANPSSAPTIKKLLMASTSILGLLNNDFNDLSTGTDGCSTSSVACLVFLTNPKINTPIAIDKAPNISNTFSQ